MESWLEYINNNKGSELLGLISRGGSILEKAKEKYQLKDSQIFTDPLKGKYSVKTLLMEQKPPSYPVNPLMFTLLAGK